LVTTTTTTTITSTTSTPPPGACGSEDFTTYTEDGPDVAKIHQVAERAEWYNLQRNDQTRAYYDYGAGYFTNFTHDFNVHLIDTYLVNTDWPLVYLLVYKNEIDWIFTAGQTWIRIYINTEDQMNPDYYRIAMDMRDASITVNSPGSYIHDIGDKIYCRLTRTDREAWLYVYSDEARTNLLETIYCDCNSPGSGTAWRYIHVTRAMDSTFWGTHESNGYIECLDFSPDIASTTTTTTTTTTSTSTSSTSTATTVSSTTITSSTSTSTTSTSTSTTAPPGQECQGWETGDLDDWTDVHKSSDSTVEVTTNEPYSGSYSLEAYTEDTVDNSYGYAYQDRPEHATEGILTAWVKADTVPPGGADNNIRLLSLHDSVQPNVGFCCTWGMYADSGGTKKSWAMYEDGDEFTRIDTVNYTFVDDTWYWIKIHWKQSTFLKVWINDVLIHDLDAGDYGITDELYVTYIGAGLAFSDYEVTVWVDDVCYTPVAATTTTTTTAPPDINPYIDVTINDVDVSDDVVGSDIWRENKFGISRCDIVLNNASDQYGATFTTNHDVVVSINSQQLFAGKVDDVKTDLDGEFQDRSVLKVECIGYDSYLGRLFITKEYPHSALETAKADDVLDDSLDVAQEDVILEDKLLYAPASVAPEVKTTFRRSFLTDKWREICNMVNWDGYIDDAKWVHFFEEGAVGAETSVVLRSNAGSTSNNILRLLEGESIGRGLKNYIEVYGDNVKDHWTDINYLDWTPGSGCSVANEYTYKLPTGKSSIKLSKGAVGDMSMYLDFPKFSHTYLDLKTPGKGYYFIYHTLIAGTMDARPWLYDKHGNKIFYFREPDLDSEQGPTDQINPRDWHQVEFPYGSDLEIKDDTLEHEYWVYDTYADWIEAGTDFTSLNIDAIYLGAGARLIATGGTPFADMEVGDIIELDNCEEAVNDGVYEIETWVSDTEVILVDSLDTDNNDDTTVKIRPMFAWSQIDQFHIVVTPLLQYGDCYIDFLSFETVEVISITESAASIASYGLRMHPEYVPDKTTQAEMDDIADEILAKRKNPLKTINVTATGQIGSRYAALSLTVDSDVYGIDSVKYRIQNLHHQIRTKGIEGFEGENFVTRYELISDELSPDAQEVDPLRLMLNTNPIVAITEILRKELEKLQRKPLLQ
jgi:hypothetical protein